MQLTLYGTNDKVLEVLEAIGTISGDRDGITIYPRGYYTEENEKTRYVYVGGRNDKCKRYEVDVMVNRFITQNREDKEQLKLWNRTVKGNENV